MPDTRGRGHFHFGTLFWPLGGLGSAHAAGEVRVTQEVIEVLQLVPAADSVRVTQEVFEIVDQDVNELRVTQDLFEIIIIRATVPPGTPGTGGGVLVPSEVRVLQVSPEDVCQGRRILILPDIRTVRIDGGGPF